MRLRIQLNVLPLNLRPQCRPNKLRLPRLTRNRRHNRLLNNRRTRRYSTLRLELLSSGLLLNRTLRRPLLLLLNQLPAGTGLLLNYLTTAAFHTRLNLPLRRLRRPNNLLLNYRRLTRLLLLLHHRSPACTQRLLNNLLRLPSGNRLLNYQLLLLLLLLGGLTLLLT